MTKVMIIDGNSIGYAAHHGTKLHVGKQQIQAVFNCIKTVRGLMRAYPRYTPLVLWDKTAHWRYDLHPLYKSNRDDTEEKVAERAAYHSQKSYLFKALALLGVKQLSAENYEADDLAGYLKNHFVSCGSDVLLVTGDQDWIQLVDEKCTWFDPIRDTTVSNRNFAEFTGYLTTQYFVEGKALQGDGSDTIPGVGGIGKKGAPDFVHFYGGVETFLTLADEDKLPKKLPKVVSRFANNEIPPPSKKYGELLPVRDAYYRNMKLMDLRNVARPPSGDMNMVNSKLNIPKFEELCGELAFHSILNNIDSWLEPFKRKR